MTDGASRAANEAVLCEEGAARGQADLQAGKGERQPDLGAKPHLPRVSAEALTAGCQMATVMQKQFLPLPAPAPMQNTNLSVSHLNKKPLFY